MRNCLAIAGLSLSLLFIHSVAHAQAPAAKAKHRNDQILVMPKPGVNPQALDKFHTGRKSSVLKTFPGIRGLQVVRLPAGEPVANAIARYQQSGLVEFAEPDFQRELLVSPNDTYFANGTLWGLNNTGQNGGTPDADIDAPEAWDVLNSASNIVVAILDTGINPAHEDLATNVWRHPVDGGYGWNALATNNAPGDDEGHGTLVAGVLGAEGNNSKGVVGVAWRVQIMACKCFNASKVGFDSDIIQCIDYARTNGARIINASLGGTGYSSSLSNAIVAARNAGIIVVASAGNTGANLDATPYYPASYDIDNIVSVAATTRTDNLWGSSSYGATNVDLAAPGDQIYSTFVFVPYLGPLGGTSFAAPYVSGTLALMLAKFPGETHQQIIARLLAAIDPKASLTGKCVTGGRLNTRKALSPDIVLTPLAGSPATITVAAGPNRECIVQRSTNLTDWISFTTNTTSTSGTFVFTNTLVSPPVFFRATAAP
jgi:subtilisin family serine protease